MTGPTLGEAGLGGLGRGWRAWARALLATYLVVLVWVVLFKLSLDVVAVVRDYQSRTLNLIPFAGVSWAHPSELISNILAFVPFGVLLGVVLPRDALWWKLGVAFLVSVAFETTQYVLAIGTTDITDVITNTLGALVGLVLYGVVCRYVDRERLDRVVVVVGTVLLVAVVLLRSLVRVRYV